MLSKALIDQEGDPSSIRCRVHYADAHYTASLLQLRFQKYVPFQVFEHPKFRLR